MFDSLIRINLAMAVALTVSLGLIHAADADVIFDWVEVGNTGNAADSTGYGAVGYRYGISPHEVTNAQYTQFLNAVAASDPNGLYNEDMGTDARGGITRSGIDTEYTYSTKANMADKPVNYVSWYDAARFTNWMTNGQGNGDTESGVYTLTGPSSISGITRDLNNWRQVFIPSEDEWYKAAYHQPSSEGGDVDDYWLYATASNDVPDQATADSNGNINNVDKTNVANYSSGAGNTVTTVGSAGPDSKSFYGTSDQAGNVFEWLENTPSHRFRGGSWGFDESFMRSTNPLGATSTSELSTVGFRVATSLPEPASIALLAIGAPMLLRRRR